MPERNNGKKNTAGTTLDLLGDEPVKPRAARKPAPAPAPVTAPEPEAGGALFGGEDVDLDAKHPANVPVGNFPAPSQIAQAAAPDPFGEEDPFEDSVMARMLADEPVPIASPLRAAREDFQEALQPPAEAEPIIEAAPILEVEPIIEIELMSEAEPQIELMSEAEPQIELMSEDEPDLDAFADPVAAPEVEPVMEPPVAELLTEPVAELALEAAEEPTAGPDAELVMEASAEPVAKAADELVMEAVAAPVAEAITEPVAAFVEEAVAEPEAELVLEAVEEPAAAPAPEILPALQTSPAKASEAVRHRLPSERDSVTHKFSIGGHEGYLTVGLYPDTRQPAEIFIRMSKEGSTTSGLLDSFATAISLALQYGVPLQALADKFIHSPFEPSGLTGNQEIPVAKSVIDYIFQYLALRFLPAEDRPGVGLFADPPADDAFPVHDTPVSRFSNGSGHSNGTAELSLL